MTILGKDNPLIGKLFYSNERSGNIFIILINDAPPLCKKCGSIISNIIFIRQYSAFNKWEINLYCGECIKKIKFSRFADPDLRAIATLTDTMPKGKITAISSLIGGMKESSGPNAITVFDIDKIDSIQTIDKTKYSGGESIAGAKIGKELEHDPLKKVIKTEKALKKLLGDIRGAVPVIEERKIKRIK